MEKSIITDYVSPDKEGVIFADLHLDLWPRNNPEPEYRMRKQPMMLAQRITEVMKEHNTNTLFNLGDTLNNYECMPQVLDVLACFYKKLIEANPNIKIYYIVGQHDIRIRDNPRIDNSYVHRFLDTYPKNLFYMHDKSLLINNTSIYMSNFSYSGIIYPPVYHNIFLSHIVLGYTKCNSSCYDLCVAGDIHDFYDSGKNHSVGTPYMHWGHQPNSGVLGIVTFNGPNSTFKRISSDSDTIHFLRFDKEEKANNTKEQPSETIKEDDKELQKIKDNAWDNTGAMSQSTIMQFIDKAIQKRGLEDIHKEINLGNIPVPISFKFKFHKMEIENVRSIEKAEFNFDNLKGITYLQGECGSGKSSVFFSLKTALAGNKNMLRNKKRKAKGKMIIKVWLTYENIDYYIERFENNELIFSINGEEQKFGKRHAQDELEKKLPWIKYFDYFYIQPGGYYFEKIDKVEFVKVLFNLHVLDYLEEEGTKLRDTAKIKCKESNLQVIQNTAKLEAQKGVYEEQKKAYDSLGEVKDENELRNKKSDIQSLVSSIDSLSNEYARNKRVIETKKKEYEETNKELSSYNKKEIIDEISLLDEEIANADNNNKAFHALENKISNSEWELRRIEASQKDKKICPKCGYLLTKDYSNEINEYKTKINELKTQLSKMELISSLPDKMARVRKLNSLLNKFDILENNKNSLKDNEISLTELLKEREMKEKTLEEVLSNLEMSDPREAIDSLTKEIEAAVFKKMLKEKVENYRLMVDSLIKETNKSIEMDKNNEQKLEGYQKYIDTFDSDKEDSIPYEILKQLILNLNNDMVRFETTKIRKNVFQVSAFINVNGEWIDYIDASDGQKSYLDLFILIRITSFIGGVGMIILDEAFKYADETYLEKSIQILQEIKTESILLTSHTSMFTNYDNLINFQLVDGTTYMS